MIQRNKHGRGASTNPQGKWPIPRCKNNQTIETRDTIDRLSGDLNNYVARPQSGTHGGAFRNILDHYPVTET